MEVKMKANKKKIIVLCGMILLLVATGVLNYYLNSRNNSQEPTGDGTVVATYFSDYRDYRETTRQETFTYLDTIILSDASSAEAKAAAETQKLDLCSKMETELIIENLIKAKGFDDAVVSMTTGNINVVVKTADSLDSAQVAQILAIVTEQTDYKATEVIIIPYN